MGTTTIAPTVSPTRAANPIRPGTRCATACQASRTPTCCPSTALLSTVISRPLSTAGNTTAMTMLSRPLTIEPASPSIRPSASSAGSIWGRASWTISWITWPTPMTAAVSPSVDTGFALM
jgi:hypothetical protein